MSKDEQLARDGAYFLKRDRNKDGTISIYTCKSVVVAGRPSNQTVRVKPTNTNDPDVAEIALKRFVLTSKEAKQKERQRQAAGTAESKAIDRPILEVLNLYYLGKIDKRRVDEEEKLEAALANSSTREEIDQIKDGVRRAKDTARAVRTTMEAVRNAWPDNPLCSALDRDMQKEFVTYGRKTGWTDNTISNRLNFTFAAMHWCDTGGQLTKFPRKINQQDWEANTDSSSEGDYTLDEMARLFKAAEEDEFHWRYMVCATATASRPTALLQLRRKQVNLVSGVCKLNPEGRRQTKKRRAKVRMCPTFINEVASWPEQEDGRVIGLLSTFHWNSFTRKAGVTGSPMRIRHTVRTWLSSQGVVDAQADIFVGHAEEGSATGRRWYKHLKPTYLQEAADAVEKLFMEIARINGRPFAGMKLDPPRTLMEMVAAWSTGAANEWDFAAEAALDTQTGQSRDNPVSQVIDRKGVRDTHPITR